MYNYKNTFLFVLILHACSHTDSTSNQEIKPLTKGTAQQHAELAWQQPSSEDQILNDFKRLNKPTLLLWSASWCPSCKELKARLAKDTSIHAAFNALSLIEVDGDLYPQFGATHNLKAYPTLLLLDKNFNEIARLDPYLANTDLLKQIQQLTADQTASVSDLLALPRNTLTTEQHTTLSQLDWDSLPERLLNKPKHEILEELLRGSLPELHGPRGAYAAALISMWAKSNDGVSRFKPNASRRSELFAYMLLDEASSYAARKTLLFDVDDVFTKLGNTRGRDTLLLQEKWLTATDRIRRHPNLTDEMRIWSWYPRFYFLKDTKTGLDSLRVEYLTECEQVVLQNKDYLMRDALLPAAAFILAEAGDSQTAINWLKKEKPQSPHPFYYDYSLAKIYSRLNQRKLAKEHAQAAWDGSRGKTTRLDKALEKLIGSNKKEKKQ